MTIEYSVSGVPCSEFLIAAIQKFNLKLEKHTKTTQHAKKCVHIFLPSGEGGDEEGGLEDLAGGNGMSGRGLREVGTGWRDCEVMEGEKVH